jgi:hypothetical protein
MLSFVSLLVRRYRECPELGWSAVRVLDQPHAGVLALCSSVDDATVVTLHNLSPHAVSVPLRLDAPAGHQLVDLLQDGRTEVGDDGAAEVLLDGYGYRWLRVVSPETRRLV